MAYLIDARLERGAPSLTLVDAVTGEERFHWRAVSSDNGERDWQGLFKRLVLLSCIDQLNLVERAKLQRIGEACLECTECVEHNSLSRWQEGVELTRARETSGNRL